MLITIKSGNRLKPASRPNSPLKTEGLRASRAIFVKGDNIQENQWLRKKNQA
ncbi:hypothetical protein K4A83_07035 [Spirulina subsalsa FACHB-351]|uniref:Uncharacterized protein n=1 Tax=Spirulina subsalsa FACHB-351 TaxID=234711 RepID=A0ABT3L3E1_9CYAN|nr:hypothetical protein [Spirulina subsalsa]MCW6036026.1 hypothetical protein [Spirulina subsalsa FACHB-351]